MTTMEIDRTRLYVEERVYRCAAMTRERRSAGEIAQRLGVSQRAVVRYRNRARQMGLRLGHLQMWTADQPIIMTYDRRKMDKIHQAPSAAELATLNLRERRKVLMDATAAYTEAGCSTALISIHLGIVPRTVHKYRSDLYGLGGISKGIPPAG